MAETDGLAPSRNYVNVGPRRQTEQENHDTIQLHVAHSLSLPLTAGQSTRVVRGNYLDKINFRVLFVGFL